LQVTIRLNGLVSDPAPVDSTRRLMSAALEPIKIREHLLILRDIA
jgi:hypothetical protein